MASANMKQDQKIVLNGKAYTIAELEKLQKVAEKKQTISVKKSDKTGAVSVYGLQRFPITLYAEQWERLLEEGTVGKIKKFIEENRGELTVKE